LATVILLVVPHFSVLVQEARQLDAGFDNKDLKEDVSFAAWMAPTCPEEELEDTASSPASNKLRPSLVDLSDDFLRVCPPRQYDSIQLSPY
jgi:hypothetical protein